jgi:uncharacterized protein YqeY
MKQKIQELFITAMKAKDENAKAALSSLKAKITEAEKVNGQEVTEAETLKVITTAIKQRKQSYEAFTQAGREDLARKEHDEMLVLESLMPKQMTDAELNNAVAEIVKELSGQSLPFKAMIGKTVGAFNKKYPGLAENARVQSVAEFFVDKVC